MVERPRERDAARDAQASVCRFEADEAAERRRDSDAPSGIAAERCERFAARDRDGRAAGGSAGDLRLVPGIAYVAEMRIHRADAVRELVHPELPNEHCSGVLELAHRSCVLGRDPLAKDLRSRSCADASRREEILHRDRYSVERTKVVARADLGLGATGLLPREVGRYR